MLGLNQGEFVEWVEAHFAQVGFFFVSSIGKQTEIVVQAEQDRLDQAPSQQPLQQPGGFGKAPASLTSGPPARPLSYRLVPKVSMGKDKTRQPEPHGVLFPLLWLLMS